MNLNRCAECVIYQWQQEHDDPGEGNIFHLLHGKFNILKPVSASTPDFIRRHEQAFKRIYNQPRVNFICTEMGRDE